MYKVITDSVLNPYIISELEPSIEQFTQTWIKVTWTNEKGFVQKKYLNSNLIKSISVIQDGE